MDLKQQIQELPIESIISTYIHLQRVGNNLAGLCPFHRDTRPSLRVHTEKKIFKCFACGAGGDGISFVMEYLKIPFIEALQQIAKDHHLSSTSGPFVNMREISELYCNQGRNSAALSLFLKDRKISRETADTFQIGIATEEDVVVNYLKLKDIPSHIGIELGLIRQEGSEFRDVFKNRIMFPICQEDGIPSGFSGRAIFPDQQPKYINSKASDVFNKSEILFGLNINKKNIGRERSVLLVEGYMDLIALYEHGIRNVVAVMGTSISERNIKRLMKHSSEIVIGFDSDLAGEKARDRVAQNFLEAGIVASTIHFDPWKDADDFLRNEEFGNLEITKRMLKAHTWLDYKLFTGMYKHTEFTIKEKLDKLHEIYELVSPLGNSLEATERIIHYAKVLDIKSDSDLILGNYQTFLKDKNLK